MNNPPPPDYSDISIAILKRELSRRPDVVFLGRFLQSLTPTEAVAIDPNDVAPLFLRLAKTLIDDSAKRALFQSALDTVAR